MEAQINRIALSQGTHRRNHLHLTTFVELAVGASYQVHLRIDNAEHGSGIRIAEVPTFGHETGEVIVGLSELRVQVAQVKQDCEIAKSRRTPALLLRLAAP